MRRIDDIRWMMHHFEGDEIEARSVAFTMELFKTIAVAIFAVMALHLV